MLERRRTLAVLMAVVMIAGLGCAGSQTRDDAEVQGEPPEEEPSDEMPEGPPVKTDGELPEGADAEGSGEADAESTGEPAAEQEGSESDRAVMSERQQERILEKGPAYLFQVVQLEPAKKDGQFRGYEVAGARPEVEEAMSSQIEVGDIVVRANGVAIERPDDYMEAWEAFAEEDEIRIELLRDGERKSAHWVVRSDSSDGQTNQ